jgi:O-antigen ligase
MRALRGQEGRSATQRLLDAGALLIGVIAIMEVAGGRIASRILLSGVTDPDRYQAMQAALRAALDHLWTGSGAGTFQSVFPLYRPASLVGTGYWSSAHSDYLDAFLGLGILGSAVLLFLLASLTYRVLNGVFARRRDSHFALTGVAATVLVGLHGFVDFSLQIQGVSVTYVALLALGVAQSQGSGRG